MGAMTRAEDQTTDRWQELHERVQAYLRASGVRDPTVLSLLSQQIMTAARHRYEVRRDRSPAELVGDEIRRSVAQWTDRFIQPSENESASHRFAHARAAVQLIDLPNQEVHGFLDPGNKSEDFGRRFKGAYLQAGPELDFSNMGPRPIDLGPVSTLAGETWRTFDKWPILQAVVLWGLFMGVLLFAFLATRY